ncbi:MAG: hypothetical protein KO464_09810 [Candidatus Methanofastidiosum sp.]|nr:hypothetical protein [Methanofastidiosum sp.]
MTADTQIKETAHKKFIKEKGDLSKKYKHLENDFRTALLVIKESPCNNSISVRVAGLGKNVTLPVFKVREFKSQDFPKRGLRSGFRIIYMYHEKTKCLIFMEIYHKNKKGEMDKERVKACFDGKGNLI